MNKLFQIEFSQGLFEVYDEKPKSLDTLSLHQTHSEIIISEDNFSNDEIEGDGLICSYKYLADFNKALAIKTADCLPILYQGKTHAGLVHAGWRGIHNKIYLKEELQNIQPNEIYIGPCIHQKSFEVQDDFRANFPDSPYFNETGGKLTFDLIKEALRHLKKSFPQAKISASEVCTFENSAYNSYRRDKTIKRNWNIFRLKG